MAVFKFFEKECSFLFDMSDFSISFQIKVPWYLKPNFPFVYKANDIDLFVELCTSLLHSSKLFVNLINKFDRSSNYRGTSDQW